MTTILISRFLIDLQEASRKEVFLDSHPESLHFSAVSSVGTINFARHVIGSIGASLNHLGMEHSEFDETYDAESDNHLFEEDSEVAWSRGGKDAEELLWEVGLPGKV